MKTILLTDGEFTGMIRTLRDIKEQVRIIGFVSSENVAHVNFLDKAIVAPDWRDEAYIPFLCDVIKEEKVDYVFPVITTSLELMAEKANEIKEKTGATIITSSKESIHIANNKALLFESLSKSGLAEYITTFKTAHTVGELKTAVTSFISSGIECISKPVCGENAEGFMHFVSDGEYAMRRLKGTASSLATLSLFDSLKDETVLPEDRLIMPYLPGDEWDVDVLVNDGEITAATVRKNLDMFGGLSACTMTVDQSDILKCCKDIVKHLGLKYLACISFKADENGNPKLLEINPRAMGSIHFSTMAGNNLAEKLFDNMESSKTDEDIKDDIATSEKTVVTQPGFMASLYYDLTVVTSPENETIKWNELLPPAREIYDKYYEKVNTKITDLVFNCRFAWDILYRFRWRIMEDCLVQVSYGGDHGNPFLLMPMGELTTEKLEKIVSEVRDDFQSRGLELTIYGIDEKYLPLFENMNIPHEPVIWDDDFSDYLYDAEELRSLSGRKFSKKRNHLSHFLQEHPDYVYESLNSKHFDGCLKLIRRWAEEKGIDVNDVDNSDYPMIENMFRHWDKLNARGGAILLNGEVAAFSVGSFYGDTAFIHFEKADAEIDGLYVAINQLTIKNEFPEAVYVNREEDLGIPGLRHAKQSYYPIQLIRKYKIKIRQ